MLRGRLRRVVPRDNEAINESVDRGSRPLQLPRHLRRGPAADAARQAPTASGSTRHGRTALAAAVGMLLGSDRRAAARALGTLVIAERDARRGCICSSASRAISAATTSTIDCAQRDFRDQAADPRAPLLGCSIADLDTRQGHSRRRLELAHGSADRRAPRPQGRAQRRERRVREPGGLRVPLQARCLRRRPRPTRSSANLAAVLARGGERRGHGRAARTSRAPSKASRSRTHIAPRRKRSRASRRSMLLGQIAQRHPQYADLRALAAGARRHRRARRSAT